MKPRRHLSNRLTAIGASTLLSIALTGITCGSFAWFAYTSRAEIQQFKGVTIGVNELEMGIISDVELDEADSHHLIKDETYPNQTIYWLDGHKMEPEDLNYVLSMNGYATNTLYATTTKKYSNGEDFGLFSTPKMYESSQGVAEKEEYIHLSLVFRCKDFIEETYISDENIYLSQVKLNVLSQGSNIHEAIRVYTDNTIDNKHLINPSSSDDGSTDVGGALDLNGDGFYDVDYFGNNDHERIYGQVKESHYKNSPETDDTIIFPDQRTSFHAGHKAGTYALESCIPETADYEGMYGFRNKRKSVTTTNSLTDNLAYLDLSIFVEGWDLSVIDSEIGLPFSMELKFEVVI